MKYLLTLGLLGLARGESCSNNLVSADCNNDCIWGTSEGVGKCYSKDFLKYYCSNDSEIYAVSMGGILCTESTENPPTCPNNKPCLCIDVDGECVENDDWGYELETPEPCSGFTTSDDCPGFKCAWGSSGAEGACYSDYDITYYCSNDGGEPECPPGNPPTCPNKKPCLCIDPDGDCNDDDDDWGYVNPPPESSASQLSLVMPLATVAIACLSRV